jgi:hypothetical protein
VSAPLRIEYDAATDIATIEGIKFSGELLRAFAGGFPDDRSYRVERRGDMVAIHVLYDADPWWTRLRQKIERWWLALTTALEIRRDIEALRRAADRSKP